MLYLDFSCTQRLMTPISPDIKDSLEDRVCAVFSSIFLLVDASVHLFAATYKGFGWTASQISRKHPSDYYKEAYPHLIKALCCTSMIFFSSLVGFICPNVFQSKKLQEYLGWKASLTNDSKTTEDSKTLEKELQSKSEEIERLKLQIDSFKEITPSTVPGNNPQFLTRMIAPDSFRAEDIMSMSSDSDIEFADALEDVSGLNKILEKELQSKNEEIEGLKSQIDLLNKILSPLTTLHFYNQVLVIQKALNKSIIDTPTIYKYLSNPVKQEITAAFQGKFKKNFFQFCNQTNPDIDSASQTLTELLDKHTFRYLTNPKEGSISAVINTLFGFI